MAHIEPRAEFPVSGRPAVDPGLADALATKARLEAVIATAMDAIVTVDHTQHIVFFNPAAEKMFGLPIAEAIGQPIERFIPARLRNEHGDHVGHFDAGLADGPTGIISALRADGTELLVEASISQAVVAHERLSTVILRDVTERLANEEVRTLLAREVDHRAKNALALVQALVTLTRAPTHGAFVEAVEGRIAAIARAHNLLARNQWHGGKLDQIINDEVAAYIRPGQFECEGPSVVLMPRAVQPIGLLIHELATNAVKYGALSVTEGKVRVRWTIDLNGALELEWRETGGPVVAPPTSKGFGTTLISTVTAQQLSGSVSVDYDPAGIIASALLPPDILREPLRQIGESLSAAPAAAAAAGSSGRVLIVEDEVLIAMQMKEVLTQRGWQVLGPVTNMNDASALLDSHGTPDVAVLDANLNGELAAPLAKRLRDAGVPVVLCTGYERIDDDRFASCILLRKPANLQQLVSGIERAIEDTRRQNSV